MELYTVSTSATRAYAWTMAHTAVSGEAFAFGSASFAPTLSRWTFFRPKRARTFLVAFFTTVTPPAIVSGVRVARRAVRVPSDGRAETTSTQK